MGEPVPVGYEPMIATDIYTIMARHPPSARCPELERDDRRCSSVGHLCSRAPACKAPVPPSPSSTANAAVGGTWLETPVRVKRPWF